MLTLAQLRHWLSLCNTELQAAKDRLTELDRAIGDADHGLNMARGFAKVEEKLAAAPPADIAALFKTTGMTLLSSVGGASGPLYGTFFLKAAAPLAGKTELTLSGLAAAFEAGTQGVIQRGHAQTGDKTLIDVWLPVCAELTARQQESDTAAVLAALAQTARQASAATIPLQAKKGRASYLQERSIGHEDPGAASSLILIETLAQAVES